MPPTDVIRFNASIHMWWNLGGSGENPVNYKQGMPAGRRKVVKVRKVKTLMALMDLQSHRFASNFHSFHSNLFTIESDFHPFSSHAGISCKSAEPTAICWSTQKHHNWWQSSVYMQPDILQRCINASLVSQLTVGDVKWRMKVSNSNRENPKPHHRMIQ